MNILTQLISTVSSHRQEWFAMKNTFISFYTKDINTKHHYLFKIRPFDTTKYAPFAYLSEVRMHTENDEQHMTLNNWVSQTSTLALATMKSTNTERDDIFDLKMSTGRVYYTEADSKQICRSWLDGGNHYISMPDENYFTEYEFDCIDLSKFSFYTAQGSKRYARSCEIVVYIDGEEKYSNIFNGLSPSKSHFSIALNESGTEIKEVSVN